MKNLTIGQRMNTTMAALVLLLLVGVGMALWAERIRAHSVQRADDLFKAKDRVYFDLVAMSDAFRGLLIWPRNEKENRHLGEVKKDLAATCAGVAEKFETQSSLLIALNRLQEFAAQTLVPYYDALVAQAESDPAGASEKYSRTFEAVRTQRDNLYAEFNRQVAGVAAQESERAWRIATGVGFGALAFVLIASIAVGRRQSTAVSAPLNELTAAIERMRGGDFTRRLTAQRRDEFGVLGDGFNRLADDLSALVGQVQRSGLAVNATAAQIAATAGAQQGTIADIAATTTQIGATSQDIAATSQQLVKTMNEVNAVSAETASLAGSGQAAINRMEATMRQIMDSSGTVTAKLAVLNEKTANINSVVTTITKVADQTNLLSLNAAIEAEKAGEAGLGFSVVAMEIRRLADQTAVATYDIEKMVKEMQTATVAGVRGMDKFSDEVQRGVAEIRQVSTQLAQIIHQVQTLPPRFQTVNDGMNAQATGAKQISETLTQLGGAARRTAESLRQSQLAIERLNEAARGLENSVAHFKLAT